MLILKMQDVKNKNLDNIVSQLKSIKLTTLNVIETLHSIMELVEGIDKTIKGTDKKQLAIDTLKYILNHQSDLSENNKLLISNIIDEIVPQTIDIMINISNGISTLVKSSSCCSFFK